MNQTADLTEKTLSREEKYQGSFLSLHVDQVQLPNGRTSFREVVEHVDGVAILALDDRNNVLTVTQYRYVFGKTLLEIPAGKLDEGEDPVTGALRELKEETGFVAGRIAYLTTIATSGGFTDELIHIYLATQLSFEGAQPDEDEFLNVELVDVQELVDAVLDGKIEDAKTVVGALACDVMAHRLAADDAMQGDEGSVA